MIESNTVVTPVSSPKSQTPPAAASQLNLPAFDPASVKVDKSAPKAETPSALFEEGSATGGAPVGPGGKLGALFDGPGDTKLQIGTNEGGSVRVETPVNSNVKAGITVSGQGRPVADVTGSLGAATLKVTLPDGGEPTANLSVGKTLELGGAATLKPTVNIGPNGASSTLEASVKLGSNVTASGKTTNLNLEHVEAKLKVDVNDNTAVTLSHTNSPTNGSDTRLTATYNKTW